MSTFLIFGWGELYLERLWQSLSFRYLAVIWNNLSTIFTIWPIVPFFGHIANNTFWTDMADNNLPNISYPCAVCRKRCVSKTPMELTDCKLITSISFRMEHLRFVLIGLGKKWKKEKTKKQNNNNFDCNSDRSKQK